MDTNHPLPSNSEIPTQGWLEIVSQHVSSLRFGVVEIIIHDGRVMQIEKTERLRLDRNGSLQS